MGTIYSLSAEVKPAAGAEEGREGTVWKMNEEEGEQILQGVNKEMRRKDEEKEEGKERKRRFPPVVFH